jgi:hypothetical protein
LETYACQSLYAFSDHDPYVMNKGETAGEDNANTREVVKQKEKKT